MAARSALTLGIHYEQAAGAGSGCRAKPAASCHGRHGHGRHFGRIRPAGHTHMRADVHLHARANAYRRRPGRLGRLGRPGCRLLTVPTARYMHVPSAHIHTHNTCACACAACPMHVQCALQCIRPMHACPRALPLRGNSLARGSRLLRPTGNPTGACKPPRPPERSTRRSSRRSSRSSRHPHSRLRRTPQRRMRTP